MVLDVSFRLQLKYKKRGSEFLSYMGTRVISYPSEHNLNTIKYCHQWIKKRADKIYGIILTKHQFLSHYASTSFLQYLSAYFLTCVGFVSALIQA